MGQCDMHPEVDRISCTRGQTDDSAKQYGVYICRATIVKEKRPTRC